MEIQSSESYTPLLKGYLTYPQSPIINGIFLIERKRARYKVTIDDVVLIEHSIKDPLKKLIENLSGSVKKIDIIATCGKSEIFGLKVTIRKLFTKRKFTDIRIRVTGDTVNELMDNISIIKDKLAEYRIKPKECLWDRIIN